MSRAMAAAAPGVAGVVSGQTITAPTRLLAVYPTAAAAGATIVIEVIPKSGPLQRVLEFTPQTGWERRYAFEPPIDLQPGTQLQVSASGALVLNEVPSVP
jgi:hypothetical protein